MNNVVLNTNELLKVVTSNRDKHLDNYNKVYKEYRKDAAAFIAKMHKDCVEGKDFETSVNLPIPANHTSDYNRVIRMLEMTVDKEIILTSTEFDQYVQDDWSWSRSATITNSFYLNKASS